MLSRAVRHLRSNVVAYLALVIAVAGVPTAWALSANSVGSKQIKPGAVKSGDIADNTITGKDVNESKLGKVPNASSADDAGTAQSLGGFGPSDFLHSNLVASGAGDPTAVPAQTILSLPNGLQVKTDGDADSAFAVAFSYADDRDLTVADTEGEGEGDGITFNPTTPTDTFVVSDTVDLSHAATIWCGRLSPSQGQARISCSALQPPS